MNARTYDLQKSDLVPAVFARNMPQSEEYFEFTYRNGAPAKTFDRFADDVFTFGIEQSQEQPYMYSSFEIFQADKQNQEYKFVNYVNLTSPMSSVNFP